MNTNCLHFNFTNCFEDQIATILQSEFDYRKIGAFCWNFSYQKGQGIESPNILSNRLELLEKYFGYTIVTFNTGNNISEILTWLTKKYEVVVSVKSNKCPWDVNFNTEYNGTHIITVKGYDSVKKNYICYDAWQQLNHIELNQKQFAEMYNNRYFLVFKNTHTETDFNIRQRFYTHVSYIMQNNMFNNMHDFVNDIPEYLNHFYNGLNCYETSQNRLINLMYRIILDRFAIANFADIYMENKSIEIKFSDIAKEWQIARGTIVKAFMFPENQSTIVGKALIRLHHIIDLEEETADFIINNRPVEPKTNYNITYHHIQNCSQTIQPVDLSKYYNMLSIDGNSIFVPKKNSIASNYVGTIKYQTPEFITHHNNHVLCKGQKINIGISNISHLYFLGACDWGEFCEDIIVHLKDGPLEKYPISFPDWCTLEDELDYIAGTPTFYNNNKFTKQNAEVRIYSTSIDFNSSKNISSIELPFCLNMHIFALSLGI